jgi:hypothetical protein
MEAKLNRFSLFLVLLILSQPLLAVEAPWSIGETLSFSVDYGPINAGTAELSISKIIEYNGFPCWKAESRIRSNTVFSAFYNVRDKAVSYIDISDLHSRFFSKRLREGDYRRNIVIDFDRPAQLARYLDGREYEIPDLVHDVLSATYYVRTIDLHLGQKVSITTHSSKKNHELKVNVVGRETVTVPAGTFDCWIVEPVFDGEGLFSYEGKITIWVSDDALRIPVMTKTKVKVGAITATLQKYSAGEGK